MFPSADNIDIEALSGIFGSISIACWVVVYSPQIIENFRRGSADGLSLLFVIVWLTGDVFNILGATLQGVLPTMIILAAYYCLADVVLFGQCLYYRGFTSRAAQTNNDKRKDCHDTYPPAERSLLLSSSAPDNKSVGDVHCHESSSEQQEQQQHRDCTGSVSSFYERFASVDGTHLSPATPFIDPLPAAEATVQPPRHLSTLQVSLFNAVAVALVCAAGALGWYVSFCTSGYTKQKQPAPGHSTGEDELPTFHFLGQVFGYLCAAFYLSSRLPQLLLNFRRKSTNGLSLLFFLFACVGNLMYVLSIFAYSPHCTTGGRERLCHPGEAATLYGRYIMINLPWLLGSLGVLSLDMGIFVQFFLYGKNDGDENESDM